MASVHDRGLGYSDERKDPNVRLTCDPGWPFRNVQEMKETAYRRGHIESFEVSFYRDILNSTMSMLTASNADAALCYAAVRAVKNNDEDTKKELLETLKRNNLFKGLINALRQDFLIPPDGIVFQSDADREMLGDMLERIYRNFEDVWTEALARMMTESMLYNYEESAELFRDFNRVSSMVLTAKGASVKVWQGITSAKRPGFFPAVE